MKIEQNSDSGGISIQLFPGDPLEAVPETHAPLLTPRIRQVYEDPIAYLRRMRNHSRFDKLNLWLDAAIQANNWSLALHRGHPDTWTSTDFYFKPTNMRGLEITPSDEFYADDMPEGIIHFHEMFKKVHWNGFGAAGGLLCPSSQKNLDDFMGDFCRDKRIDTTKTYVFGVSSCGDMLIYTTDDRAGWLNHGSGEVKLLGTSMDLINCIFDRLIQLKSPEYYD